MKITHSLEALETRIAPAGIVAVDYNEATGELTLTGDGASNAIDIFQVAKGVFRIEGRDDSATGTSTSINEVGNGGDTIQKLTRLTLNMGAGDDEIDLSNLEGLKGLVVDLGSGADSLDAYNVSSRGDVRITTGSGADVVEFSGRSTSIKGDLTINDSEGGLEFELGAAATSIRGQISFNGGTGDDILTTRTETNLTVTRGILFDGGASGANSLDLGNQGTIRIGKSGSGQSVSFMGGVGTDSISIGANTVALKGSVEMNGGDGADLLDIDGQRVTVGKSSAGLSVQLLGGNGLDEMDLQGASFRTAGSLRFDGGGDADYFDFTNVQALTVRGSVQVNGGAGQDIFEMDSGKLSITGGITFDGGTEADSFTIEADGKIKGSVSILMGAADEGVQAVEVAGFSGLSSGLKIQGGLTVDAIGATAMDVFRLTNVAISKAVSLSFGNGVSDVDIDNLSAAAAVTINTAGGADDLRIETDAVYGISQFRQSATISMGDGDDLLRIGKDSRNNRVAILGTLSVDGGSGDDTRNDIAANNDINGQGRLVSTSFEEEDFV